MTHRILQEHLKAEEIIHSLSLSQSPYFYISDIPAYAEKIRQFGKCLCIRNESGILLSYILYYDNQANIFISMVWTDPGQQGKGLAQMILRYLIQQTNNDIVLDVHKKNPAIFLYKKMKFRVEAEKDNLVTMRYQKRISIIQPYTFPYIGYFNLIESSDKTIFYDDVHYINRGWINRNRILLNRKDHLFTIPLQDASQNKLILDIKPFNLIEFSNKFKVQLESAYKKAPHYKEAMDCIMDTLNKNHYSIADLAISSLKNIYDYLAKDFQWDKSSICSPHTMGMEKADRLIRITTEMGYRHYINPISGQELYSKDYFAEHGINLHFVKPVLQEYRQFAADFVPGLSIIDILMFNEPKVVAEMMNSFEVV